MGYDLCVTLSQCLFVAFICGLLTLICGPHTALLWAFVWACASTDILIARFKPNVKVPAWRDIRWRWCWQWWMLPALALLVALLVYGVDCLLLFLDDVL